MSCIDKINETLSDVMNIDTEIPQSLIIDVFFRFSRKYAFDYYINSRLNYQNIGSFIKFIITGFIPESEKQENLIFNRTYNLLTLNKIKPGYVYILKLQYKGNVYEYILIRPNIGKRYIYSVDNDMGKYVDEFYIKHILPGSNVTVATGSSRLISFKYLNDYIQVFRNLEYALKLSEIYECDQLVNLVEIFIRTMKLRFNTYSRLNIIPNLIIESGEALVGTLSHKLIKYSKENDLKIYLKEIEMLKHTSKYMDIYNTLLNFDLSKLNETDISDYLQETLGDVIPMNTLRTEISDTDQINIIIAMSMLDIEREIYIYYSNDTLLNHMLNKLRLRGYTINMLYYTISKYFAGYGIDQTLDITSDIRIYITAYELIKHDENLVIRYFVHMKNFYAFFTSNIVYITDLEFLIELYLHFRDIANIINKPYHIIEYELSETVRHSGILGNMAKDISYHSPFDYMIEYLMRKGYEYDDIYNMLFLFTRDIEILY